MRQHREIQSLTGLRFIAALYVFIFHIQIRWPVTDTPVLKNIIEQGAIGMSIFFMLSGYLLAFNYLQSPSNTSDYFLNRFARIYPIYFIAGLVTLPWLGIPFGDALEDSGDGLLKAAFIFIANLLVIQAWFPQLFSYWNNGGSWSISVEMFCYAALPLIAPYLNRLSKRGILWTVAGLYLVSLMAGFSVKLYPGYGIPVFYAMPIFRLPEFLIGVCLYLIVKNWETPKLIWIIQLMATALFFLYLGAVGAGMPTYVGHHWIVLPVVAVTIYTLAVGHGPLTWLLSRAPLVWLGKISYCFYSFQALIGLSLISHHEKLVAMAPVFENGKVVAAAAFILLTILSAAGYYFIEEPSRRFIKHRWSARKNAPNVLSASLKI